MKSRLGRPTLALALLILGVGAGRSEAGEPALPAPPDLIPMSIRTVRMDEALHSPVVILETAKRDRALPIVIGHGEAFAILRQLHSVEPPPRPMTHDLLKSVITALGGKVERVVITRLEKGTFHAAIVVRQGEKVTAIDSRASDGMALALRTGAALFVARAVLDEAGVAPGEVPDDEQPEPPPRPPGPGKQAI